MLSFQTDAQPMPNSAVTPGNGIVVTLVTSPHPTVVFKARNTMPSDCKGDRAQLESKLKV
jgi:hypothetical protein